MPLCTIGVAAEAVGAHRLWPLLGREYRHLYPAAADPGPMPAPPWCAVTLHPWLEQLETAPDWLSDFQRCLAWAWLRYAD